MKRRILWIFAITLLSGCGLLHRKKAVQAPEAKQSPEVTAEVQEAARIYRALVTDIGVSPDGSEIGLKSSCLPS